MVQFIPLPEYKPSPLLNLAPINEALDARQRQANLEQRRLMEERRMLEQRRQFDASHGLAQRQDVRAERLLPGQIDAQRAGIESQRASAAHARGAEGRAGQLFPGQLEAQRKQLEAEKFGTLKDDQRLYVRDPNAPGGVRFIDPPGGPQGITKPKDRASVEEGLRKEFASLAKPYFETRDAFSRIEEATKSPSPASDIALIFNFMKMLDPGSVVREGEFATAQNAAGVPERVQVLYNRILSGERLTPAIRSDFLAQAQGLHRRAKTQYDAIQNQYRSISERTGVDPRNTIIDFGVPGQGAADRSVSPRAPAVGAVEDGYRFKGGNPNDPASWEKVAP